MDQNDLKKRFEHHPPKDSSIADLHSAIRGHCLYLAEYLNWSLPEGREKAIVMTKLEEAMFWANAAVARSGKGGDEFTKHMQSLSLAQWEIPKND